MKCPKCGNPGVLVETVGSKGDKRVRCAKCGLDEVRDGQGRKLLLDTVGGGNVLLS